MFSKLGIKLPRTLTVRLTFWYSLAFSILFFITLAGMYLAVESILELRLKDDLAGDIEELQAIYREQGIERVQWEISQEIQYEDPEHFFIRLIRSDGSPVIESDLGNWSQTKTPTDLQSAIKHDDQIVLEEITHEDEDLSTHTAFGLLDSDLIVYLGESTEEMQEVMEALMMASIIACCLIIPVGALVGWFTARKAVIGIQEVSRAAGDIKDGQFDRRVSLPSRGDEIDDLANTFNAMAERIRKLIDEMREMTDNIAHDLRSPLARIRAISETVLSSGEHEGEYGAECRKAASDTLEECDRLLQMINMTLDVAEAEADIRDVPVEVIDLSALAEDACELFAPLAEERAISLSTRLNSHCQVTGHKHNLQRMLTNLIDNAVKYTPEHGEVIVALNQVENEFVIEVADTGDGVPEPERERIFDRFYRCDQSRSLDGCGLGLSFSRAVARAHGGDIRLTQQRELKSVFEVSIPIS